MTGSETASVVTRERRLDLKERPHRELSLAEVFRP
jgi:hypothetical protein